MPEVVPPSPVLRMHLRNYGEVGSSRVQGREPPASSDKPSLALPWQAEPTCDLWKVMGLKAGVGYGWCRLGPWVDSVCGCVKTMMRGGISAAPPRQPRFPLGTRCGLCDISSSFIISLPQASWTDGQVCASRRKAARHAIDGS